MTDYRPVIAQIQNAQTLDEIRQIAGGYSAQPAAAAALFILVRWVEPEQAISH